MHSYFETHILFTKYLTSTNMRTAQQKKGHKKNYCSSIRGGSTLCHN